MYVCAALVVCMCVCLQLTPVEIDFLTTNSSAALSEFEKVADSGAAGAKMLALAGTQVESAQK